MNLKNLFFRKFWGNKKVLITGHNGFKGSWLSLLLTSSWTAFQTESIFLDISEPSVGFEVIFPLLVVYPLFLFIVSKKYKLSNWKNKLLIS